MSIQITNLYIHITNIQITNQNTQISNLIIQIKKENSVATPRYHSVVLGNELCIL